MEDARRSRDRASTHGLLLEAGIKPGMSVLDIGCGRADVSRLLAEIVGESGKVLGIDIDKEALKYARENSPQNVEFVEADLNQIELEASMFDAIVGRRVLMYQPDADHLLRRLLPSLRQGGIMFFREIDMTWPPISNTSLPLHFEVYNWIQKTIEFENADVYLGVKLPSIFADLGLINGSLRSEVLTVDLPFSSKSTLATIIRFLIPRIVKSQRLSEEYIDIETLEQRLYNERSSKNASFIGETTLTCWAYKS